jgi:flagellar basal body rod protein FlgB
MANNIANADIKGVKRKEIRPFHQVLKKHGMIHNENNIQGRILRIDTSDFLPAKTEISKEIEMLEMSRSSLEHDAILSTVKNFHQLLRTILSMSQTG